MLFGLSPFIWIPIFFIPWIGAIACLVTLAKMRFAPNYNISSAKFWFFNITILVVVIIGIVNFLICRIFFAKKVFGKVELDEINDSKVFDAEYDDEDINTRKHNKDESIVRDIEQDN